MADRLRQLVGAVVDMMRSPDQVIRVGVSVRGCCPAELREAVLRSAPADGASVIAYLDAGVTGTLVSCAPGSDFCKVVTGSVAGYLARADFWGVFPGEIVK